MSIDKHVVSLDLAKQLVEAGVEMWTEFEWQVSPDGRSRVVSRVSHHQDDKRYRNSPDIKAYQSAEQFYPAPLASEMGELLPYRKVSDSGDVGFVEMAKGSADWRVYWSNQRTGLWIHDEQADTMSNAMAKCLIYLVKNGIVKPDDLRNKINKGI